MSFNLRAAKQLLNAGWRPLPVPGAWGPPASDWVALALVCPRCNRTETLDPVQVAPGAPAQGPDVHACPTRGCGTRFAITVVHAAVGWSLLVDGVPRTSLYWSPTQVRSFVRSDNWLADPVAA